MEAAGGDYGTVKKAHPGCEPFVGVIVQRTNPTSRLEANWAVGQ